MFISHAKKLIFIHIPKNAGTSITDFLKNNMNNNNINKLHVNCSTLKNQIKNYNDYFKFCVVRNPYDRAVSFYNYYNRIDINGPFGPIVKQNTKNFKDFVKNCMKNEYMIHLRLQYNMISDNLGNILVDKIIKYENLENDLKETLKNYNLDFTKFKHLNKSTYDNYKNYYDNETILLVQNYYKKDFESFDYDFIL